MPCARLASPGEKDGFICGEGVETCGRCGKVAEFLCDFPLGKNRTCDALLCVDCAMPVGPEEYESIRPSDVAARRSTEATTAYANRVNVLKDTHFCPAHAAMTSRV